MGKNWEETLSYSYEIFKITLVNITCIFCNIFYNRVARKWF